MKLRVAVAQLNTVVGDLAGNVDRVLGALGKAESEGADLCVFPELAVTGYPPEDLLLKPGFVRDNERALAEIATRSGECAAVVGFVGRAEEANLAAGGGLAGGQGDVPRLANAAAVCWRGAVRGVYRKRQLPNYGVFDERRWFAPGRGPMHLFCVAGVRLGVTVCEDLWFDGGPVAEQARAGADLVVNINASPYSVGRRAERLALLRRRVEEAGCDLVYVNQVGGQDELVFDGASLVMRADGTLVAAGPQFEEQVFIADLPYDGDRLPPPAELPGGGRGVVITTRPRRHPRLGPPPRPEALAEDEEVYRALVLGTADYLRKNGFDEAVLGLSGGIDSSLVATIAADALGSRRVHAVAMPSRYSSPGSLADARAVAANLGIELSIVPIEEAHRAFSSLLAPLLGGPPVGLADENLQSRVRGVLLMALSNAKGWIVLTTGNKSEMATGYSTLYGDSAGGFAVIKDVPKTLVYRLCRHRNEEAAETGSPPPIPESVLEKAPSAELRPDQRDADSLPPYEVLDPVLKAYVEDDRTAADLVASGFDRELVERVVALVEGAEYKRRQMPPGVRISSKAFGKDRRMPITNRYGSITRSDPVPLSWPGQPSAGAGLGA